MRKLYIILIVVLITALSVGIYYYKNTNFGPKFQSRAYYSIPVSGKCEDPYPDCLKENEWCSNTVNMYGKQCRKYTYNSCCHPDNKSEDKNCLIKKCKNYIYNWDDPDSQVGFDPKPTKYTLNLFAKPLNLPSGFGFVYKKGIS